MTTSKQTHTALLEAILAASCQAQRARDNTLHALATITGYMQAELAAYETHTALYQDLLRMSVYEPLTDGTPQPVTPLVYGPPGCMPPIMAAVPPAQPPAPDRVGLRDAVGY